MKNRTKIIMAFVAVCIIVIAIWFIFRGVKATDNKRTEDIVASVASVESADEAVNIVPEAGSVDVEEISDTEGPEVEKNPQVTDSTPVDQFDLFYGVVYLPDTEISYSDSEKVFYTKDEKPVLSCKFSYPVLTKYANEEARTKINSYMQRMMEDWYVKKKEEADKDEKGFYESGEEWDYHWECKSETTVYCGKVDPLIVSFYIETYDYYGGNNGFLTSTAVSFDGKSGDVLNGKDIYLDKDEFVSSCKDYILARPFLWGTKSNAEISSLIEDLIDREKYYYAHEGFVLCTDMYELGGNPDGCVPLIIPYAFLRGYNYKFDYFGNVSRAFRAGYEGVDGMVACVDLDGDRVDDYIHVDKVFDAEDLGKGSYKVYVNDNDLSDVIRKYQIDKSGVREDWFIEDVDSGDSYCEIFLRLDESTLVLRYINNDLQVLGEMEGCPSIHDYGFQVNGDGIIRCGNKDYRIENDGIVSND